MIALFALMIAGLAAFVQALATTFARPAVNTASQDAGTSRTAPTDTGQTFAVVVAERGPLTPYDVKSFTDYQRTFGARNNNTARYWDAVQAFFKYGGGALKIIRARALGVIATADIVDAGAGVSLVATALGQGTWYNGINLAFEADVDGNIRVVVTHDTDLTVNESSPYVADQASLVAWSQGSRYVRLALGATALMPAAAPNIPLAGGTDDYATITTTERLAGLVLITPSMGPGQVAIPGATTAAEWNGILEFCDGKPLDPILAYPDTADEATLTTLAGAARGFGRNGAGFAGWLIEPGVAGIPKTVEPSLPVCALIAAWDGASNGLGQNKPVAGTRRGVFRRCLGVSQSWDDPDLMTRLNAAGVNLIIDRFNGVTVWGWRSLADPNSDPDWVNFGHRRLQIALETKIDTALDAYLFEEIDGEGTLLKEVQGTIEGQILKPYYDKGSLYGSTQEEAYKVDLSGNDATTAQNRQLIVSVTVVESEFAEEIDVNIIKNLVTQGVGS